MIELTLPTMTCGHCVQTVTATIQRLDPAARLHIDLASHRVQVASDRPEDELKKALAEQGYPAR